MQIVKLYTCKELLLAPYLIPTTCSGKVFLLSYYVLGGFCVCFVSDGKCLNNYSIPLFFMENLYVLLYTPVPFQPLKD